MSRSYRKLLKEESSPRAKDENIKCQPRETTDQIEISERCNQAVVLFIMHDLTRISFMSLQGQVPAFMYGCCDWFCTVSLIHFVV